MATWTRLKRGWKIGQGTDHAYGIEHWRTADLPFNDVSANALLMDPAKPSKGDPHPDPDMKGAIVVDVQLVQGPEGGSVANKGRAVVRVTYAAASAYSGGPQPMADFSGEPIDYRIPRVKDESTLLNGPGLHRATHYMTIKRAQVIRCRTVQTVGDEIKAANLNNQILPNYGKAYGFVDGDYILHSHRLFWVATGQIVITYRFWRQAAIVGFAAVPPTWPIETPSIGGLDDYGAIDDFSLYDPGFKIPVLLGKDRYSVGAPLP